MKEENEQLKQEKQMDEDRAGANQRASKPTIPRPSGAVSAWKLQEAMQLTGSIKKREMYAGIQVCAHILRLRCRQC